MTRVDIVSANRVPDNKVHEAKMGPTWVLSAPDGPHDGPINFAIRGWSTVVDGSVDGIMHNPHKVHGAF